MWLFFSVKGLFGIKKQGGFVRCRISATPVYRLSVVLELSPIHFNGVELQYQAQPMHRSHAVTGRRSHVFIHLGQQYKVKEPQVWLKTKKKVSQTTLDQWKCTVICFPWNN